MAKKEYEPTIGDNSVNSGHLKAFIERIERLEEEKSAIAGDVKDVYAEAKGSGFDTKTMRKIVKIRAMDRDKWRESEEQLDLYLSALGLL
jgi:uncharacterized protein (UPF0335 family)